MNAEATASQAATRRSLITRFASCGADVIEAQRLRYRVFREERGELDSGDESQVDRDDLDPFCEHLLVCEPTSGHVVGTYRILPGERAGSAGGFYSEHEFNFGAGIASIMHRAIEVGRACVAPDWRNGAVIMRLWAGLAAFAANHGYEYMAGCSSVRIDSDPARAASICREAMRTNSGPASWKVSPRIPFSLEVAPYGSPVTMPPLLKGYLRLGAYVCGAPAWDRDFDTADLFTVLPINRLDERYVRRFFGNA